MIANSGENIHRSAFENTPGVNFTWLAENSTTVK